MSTRERIDALQNVDNCFRLSDGTETTSRELILGLCDAMEDSIFIPNSLLPEQLRSEKEYCEYVMIDDQYTKNYGRTAKSALRGIREIEIEHEERQEELIRQENIGLYSDQISGMKDTKELEFRENERRINNAQVNFLKLLHKMGVVDDSLELV